MSSSVSAGDTPTRINSPLPMDPVVRSPTRTAALETRWITARTLESGSESMPGGQEVSALLALDLESDLFDEAVVLDLLSFLSEESLSLSDLPPDLPTFERAWSVV